MRHDYNDHSNHSMMTFMIGALTGVAAVLILDKDMRTKVENKILEARLKSEVGIQDAKEKLEEVKDKVADKAEEKLVKAQEKLEERKANKGRNENTDV